MKNLLKQCIFVLTMIIFMTSCTRQPNSLANDSQPSETPFPPFSTPVTCEEIQLAFYKYNVPSIVKKLMENDSTNWNMIMKKIAEGNAEWIRCATLYIKPGTDAGSSEEFTDALAYALQYNPEAVLSLEQGTGISLSSVCSWPFIEPEYSFVTSYGKKTLEALNKVNNPYLLESRNSCIQRLQNGLKFLEKEYQEGRWHN